MTNGQSIFRRYYSDEPFVDRFEQDSGGAVDVIIPVLASNELWRKNLISIYREVPVARLLLGDGGCADDTIRIAQEFPRVEVHDHRNYATLGYSIKELIRAVETEWFIYVHGDVYLPDGWFDRMRSHQDEYDWFGCPMRITALVEYPHVDRFRPYAGSQMGRKAAFAAGLDRIDDDYVYRQEDFVFARLVQDAGFREGRIEDTFHYHQVMPRLYGRDGRARSFKRIEVAVEMAPEEELFTVETQLRGTIKYLEPDPYHIRGVEVNVRELLRLGKLDLSEFLPWVERTNPAWLPYVPRSASARRSLRSMARLLLSKVGRFRR